MREQVLNAIDDDNLAIHVVWTPVLRSDERSSVDDARRIFAGDDRVTQYWDDEQSLGQTYGEIVDLPNGRSLAWDIYFVYEAGIEWDNAPPPPSDWQHQLGNDARRLNGEKLRTAIRSMLDH